MISNHTISLNIAYNYTSPIVSNQTILLFTAYNHFSPMCVCPLLGFHVLATFKVISGQVPTCDNAHSWWLYSIAPLGVRAASTMPWYITQSHYYGTEPTSPRPTLITLSVWVGSKNIISNHWFGLIRVRTCRFEFNELPKRETGIQPIRPFRLVCMLCVCMYAYIYAYI